MKTLPLVLSVLGVFSAACAGSARAAVIVSTVNADAAYEGTITNAPGVTLNVASWVSTINAAQTANTGGLWNFDDNQTKNGVAWGGNNNDDTFTVNYGAAASNSLGITTSVSFNATNMSSAGSTSGQRVAQYSSASSPAVWSFTAPAGELINALGFTVIPRTGFSGAHDVTYTATFSDNSTASLTASIANTDLGYANGGTFYHFAAPAGLGISALTYTSSVTTRINPLDDLGFTTAAVPEPASLGLFAVGALTLLLRRGR